MLRFSTPLASTAVPFVRLLTYHAWPLRTCAELQACVIPPRHIWQGNDAAAAATVVSSRTRALFVIRFMLKLVPLMTSALDVPIGRIITRVYIYAQLNLETGVSLAAGTIFAPQQTRLNFARVASGVCTLCIVIHTTAFVLPHVSTSTSRRTHRR